MKRTAKVVLIGASSCGKTSLRDQYAHGRFHANYRATLGADFISINQPVAQAGSSTEVSLSVWDTAGQERFRAIASAFYRGADAVVLVFSLISRDSLLSLKFWLQEFIERCPVLPGESDRFTFLVLGNKADLEDGQLEQREIDTVLRELHTLLAGQPSNEAAASSAFTSAEKTASLLPGYDHTAALKATSASALDSLEADESASRQVNVDQLDSDYDDDSLDSLSGSPPPPLSTLASRTRASRASPEGRLQYLATSAKTGENVKRAFEMIAEQVLLRQQRNEGPDRSSSSSAVGHIDNITFGAPGDSLTVGNKTGPNESKGWLSPCC
ncbi:uncharacterized protein L969DRAFT_88769 [Mixia osmundae IAM 14324]|uniref:Ras-domain-containing protein n=1 Tax=Mixia osmundae (strain CBS 9802 / IAM 14324 / JCM 22182 / KY 12970) TaxID=764103 RepID=G7E0G4_MIXOS|nr:uncharacterized protein L969DRAFT_88769 [Mixia osmundae IAM 14324]KEI38333.1 hypothetical protein L969DRAFT_88769 [Mixia osmundae IAM 14324]GAA96324.1 hypothetical protein E5Q_02990 [Mixia osmundae IAM 14324]